MNPLPNTLKEREEEAQIIIETALRRIFEMGFGVVGTSTQYSGQVWLSSLKVKPIPKSSTK